MSAFHNQGRSVAGSKKQPISDAKITFGVGHAQCRDGVAGGGRPQHRACQGFYLVKLHLTNLHLILAMAATSAGCLQLLLSLSFITFVPGRNVCERHQHLVGSVTGSTEVVEKVRKAEGDNKGKTRRGSRDVGGRDAMGREATEVNGGFSRETRNKAEVR